MTKENNTLNCHNYCKTQSIREVTGLLFLFVFFLIAVCDWGGLYEVPSRPHCCMTHRWHQRWQGPDMLSSSLGRGWQRERQVRKRQTEGGRGWRGRASFPAGPLRVGIETLLWASGVDVMKLLLLLRLDVLVFLHSAGILHIGPVCRQNHQVVDLIGGKGKSDSSFLIFISVTSSFEHHLNNTATFSSE